MSRGPGRLQRLVLQRLREAPDCRLSRRALEQTFVDGAGYSSSNLLRSIRALQRVHRVRLYDCPDLTKAHVSLAQPAPVLSEEAISALLRELAGRTSSP